MNRHSLAVTTSLAVMTSPRLLIEMEDQYVAPVIGFILALLFLALTTIQTIYAVRSFHRDR